MKNIVICSDGTGNEYGQNNTNVVETYSICEKTAKQVVFYDPGVGTGSWEYMDGKSEGENSLKSISDKATGKGLQKNVNDAYRFLMQAYQPGDKIFLFGFSRGAFTVRSLAGMLCKVGLLVDGHENLLEYAAKLYNDEEAGETAAGFKKTFSQSCPVHFIGVWDTVSSLVLNAGKRWHNGSLNSEVKNGYHALAIDEQRKDFPPALWDESNLHAGQTIEQVWFAGVHCDVGGWYDERGLSNTALHWILGHAKNYGLKVDTAALSNRVENTNDKIHNSRKGLWILRGRHVRKIPVGAKVHASVFQRRRRRSNGYSPKNLLAISKYIVVD